MDFYVFSVIVTVLSIVFVLTVLIIMIKTVVKVIDNQELNNNSKLFWVALILTTNIVGLIVFSIVDNKNVFK